MRETQYPGISSGPAAIPLLSAMPGMPVMAADRLSEKTTRSLAQDLIHSRHQQQSGALVVVGDPGGTFHLVNGVIVAVESPGAPSVEALLLSSGRVGKADWAAAYQAGAADNRIGAELIARTLVGAAELQLICLMAALDGAFSVGMGRIGRCTFEHGPASHHLGAPQGIEPDVLLQETSRRIRAFGSLRIPLCPFRDRMAQTPPGVALLDSAAAGERREILLCVNGRRSARDIAFLLGRSLYAVTVELSRMLGDGLVEVAPAHGALPGGHEAASGWSSNVTRFPHRPAGPGSLPRRQRGASGINDVLPLRPVADRR